MNDTLTLKLPQEFLDLCKEDNIEPELVLRGFIADLCNIVSFQNNPRTDGYNSNGSDERMMAREYYERVGYPFWADGYIDYSPYCLHAINWGQIAEMINNMPVNFAASGRYTYSIEMLGKLTGYSLKAKQLQVKDSLDAY